MYITISEELKPLLISFCLAVEKWCAKTLNNASRIMFTKRHFLVLEDNSKSQDKNWVSTVHHVGEINCQTLKKRDNF